MRICSLLSLVRTELFFRQVLGRVLRKQSDTDNDSGWLYCLAEPGLIKYAEQLEKEIPEQQITSRLHIPPLSTGLITKRNSARQQNLLRTTSNEPCELILEGKFRSQSAESETIPMEELLSVWMQGKFTERVLALIG